MREVETRLRRSGGKQNKCLTSVKLVPEQYVCVARASVHGVTPSGQILESNFVKMLLDSVPRSILTN